MPFATAADGARLAYQELGSGPPLLLVSGQASAPQIWTGVREAFAERYRVVTFDHRGTGDSDKPEAPSYSTRGFAGDAIAVLDHLGIGREHEATAVGGVPDEVDDRFVGAERATSPVDRDEREQAMLDLVPLARAGR